MHRKGAKLVLVLAAILSLAACAQDQANRRGTKAATATVSEKSGLGDPDDSPAANAAPNLDTPETTDAIGEVVDEAVGVVNESINEPPPADGPIPNQASAEPATTCNEREQSSSWLDRTQKRVFWTVCGATRWFDGFFGDRARYDATVRETNGRVGLGAFWDERVGWDTDYRFRADLALPAAEARLENWRGKLRLGRGTEEELIEDRGDDEVDSLPSRFEEVDDADWLVGLGFQRGQKLDRGFDFDVGVKLRLNPDAFAKARWLRNWNVTEETLLRVHQTVFWTRKRGLGETTQIDIVRLIGSNRLLRWGNVGTLSEDRKGLDWTSSLTLFRGFSNRRALTYQAFIRGETGRQSPLQNYGIELRYRQRILRKWLFAELRGSATFPRYDFEPKRELNLGFGLFFDMYFGPVPEQEMR